MQFLFVDRILQLVAGRSIRGIKHVMQDEHYLCLDENNRLCFIPSLIGEALGQLAAWNVMQTNNFTARPVAGIVSRATLHRPAYVGETLLLESFIDALDDTSVRYHGVARVGEEEVFNIESALGPMLPMLDFIEQHDIHHQFQTIHNPGLWPPELEKIASPSFVATEKRSLPNMTFDRILQSEPEISLVAEKCINQQESYFPDHFPKKPVLPLTILLQYKLNLAQEFLREARFKKRYKLQDMRKIKMSGFVQPGDRILCHVQVKCLDAGTLILNFKSEVAGRRVCIVDMVLTERDA